MIQSLTKNQRLRAKKSILEAIWTIGIKKNHTTFQSQRNFHGVLPVTIGAAKSFPINGKKISIFQ